MASAAAKSISLSLTGRLTFAVPLGASQWKGKERKRRQVDVQIGSSDQQTDSFLLLSVRLVGRRGGSAARLNERSIDIPWRREERDHPWIRWLRTLERRSSAGRRGFAEEIGKECPSSDDECHFGDEELFQRDSHRRCHFSSQSSRSFRRR